MIGGERLAKKGMGSKEKKGGEDRSPSKGHGDGLKAFYQRVWGG